MIIMLNQLFLTYNHPQQQRCLSYMLKVFLKFLNLYLYENISKINNLCLPIGSLSIVRNLFLLTFINLSVKKNLISSLFFIMSYSSCFVFSNYITVVINIVFILSSVSNSCLFLVSHIIKLSTPARNSKLFLSNSLIFCCLNLISKTL